MRTHPDILTENPGIKINTLTAKQKKAALNALMQISRKTFSATPRFWRRLRAKMCPPPFWQRTDQKPKCAWTRASGFKRRPLSKVGRTEKIAEPKCTPFLELLA